MENSKDREIGNVDCNVSLECLKGEEVCGKVLFFLHCNAFDDFVMPSVFVGQENRLEEDPLWAFITATNLVECVPLVEAVVVIVDG